MPTDRTIDYVEFPASNFDQQQTFYAAVFGWSFKDYGPEYREFSDGKLTGGFFKSDLKSRTDRWSSSDRAVSGRAGGNRGSSHRTRWEHLSRDRLISGRAAFSVS
jgi:catechol 2,3-dioxygenase-like lactoylglutathione lyase family enzyme